MTVYLNKISSDGSTIAMSCLSGRKGVNPGNGISSLQERALHLIGSRSGGLLQAELRLLLGIESSKCSRVVSRMLSSGLIRREKVPASRTYLIRLVRPSRKASGQSFGQQIDSYLTEIYLLYLIRGSSS
jgi:DNA-binding MarR family transcriptional regulator